MCVCVCEVSTHYLCRWPIEAMQRKTKDLLAQVQRSPPPDLKRLQLLLQGCISTQVKDRNFTLTHTHTHTHTHSLIYRCIKVYRSMLCSYPRNMLLTSHRLTCTASRLSIGEREREIFALMFWL